MAKYIWASNCPTLGEDGDIKSLHKLSPLKRRMLVLRVGGQSRKSSPLSSLDVNERPTTLAHIHDISPSPRLGTHDSKPCSGRCECSGPTRARAEGKG
jgi:hypothetical protein